MIEGVEITLARYSYRDVMAERSFAGDALSLQLQLPKLQAKAVAGKSLTAKEQETLQTAVGIAQRQGEMEMALFAKTVEALPQELLVEGAPDVSTLDLRDPETYLWLRPDAASALKSLIDLRIQGVDDEGES